MEKLRLDPKIDYGRQLNATVWLLISVSAVFLFTRLYLKTCQNRGLWWDDYFLLGSWVLLAVQAGLVSHVVGLGYGRQVIPVENFTLFPIPVNILSTLLIMANLWSKTSFALTLLRIPERWIRVCVWCILISLTGALVASAVMVWISCLDFKLRGRCVPADVSIRYNLFSCVYSATIDAVLAFLPWRFLWALEMSVKEKVGVVIAMSMGVFAGAAAGIKSATLPAISKGTDPTASVPLLIWGNVEAAICIMAASIPILRALARGSCCGPVPHGYETYEYGSSGMTESGLGQSTFGRTAAMSLALPIQSPPISYAQKDLLKKETDNLDEALTSGSPKPSWACKQKLSQASENNDSFEMTNYGQSCPQSPQSVHATGRPQSPLGFIGRDPAPQ